MGTGNKRCGTQKGRSCRMEEKKNKWLAVAVGTGVFLVFLLIGAVAVSWHMIYGKVQETDRDWTAVWQAEEESGAGQIGEEAKQTEEKSHEPVRCETNGFSFEVYEDWESAENGEYAYMIQGEAGAYYIWLNGVSMLGAGTMQEMYEDLALYYQDEVEEYQVSYYDKELMEVILTDHVVCQWGVVHGSNGTGIYDTMVVMVPDKNYMITFGGYTEEGEEEELLGIMVPLCESLEFEIGSRDAISGNTFLTETGGRLCLHQDGTFELYDAQGGEGSGDYGGTYEVYYGEQAVDEAVRSLDLPPEIVERIISYNMGGYALGGVFPDNVPEGRMRYRICRDTFYVVSLHINRRISEAGGEEAIEERDANYFGFYIPELESMDFVDETTYEYAVWKFQCVTEG